MGWFSFQGGGGRFTGAFFDLYGGGRRIKPASADAVIIVSGYGAKFKHRFTLPVFLRPTAPVSTIDQIEKYLANAETLYGKHIGAADRAGLDWAGAGDPTQFDCVDEAWNATVMLRWLEQNNKLIDWKVCEPMWKVSPVRWNHYAAVIEHERTGVKYAVDGGYRPQGGAPLIVKVSEWYE